MKKDLHFFASLALVLLFNTTFLFSQSIPDFQVNENASLDGSEQSGCAIAGNATGNYIVTWKDKRNGADFDIYAQIYLNDGTPSGPNFRVNDDSASAWQERPSVGIDPNGNFVIAWIDRRNNYQEWDIYAQRFSGDGTALGNNFRVNDDLSDEHQEYPTVAMNSSGDFVIVWLDLRNGNWDIYAQRYSNNGTALESNFKINDDNN